MTLVEIRCKQCRRLLNEVTSAPTDEEGWTGLVAVNLCPRHGEGAGHGDVTAWRARRRRAGKPDDRVRTGRWLPWSELRPAVERARAGATQEYLV